MTDFSTLDFIQRDATALISQLVELQEDISDGALGDVQFAYIDGSSVGTVGSQFQARNIAGGNLTSGTIAYLGYDSNEQPFIYKELPDAGGYSGGCDIYSSTISASCNSSASETQSVSDSDSESTTFTTNSTIYGVGVKYTYSVSANVSGVTAPFETGGAAAGVAVMEWNGSSWVTIGSGKSASQTGNNSDSDSGTAKEKDTDGVSRIRVFAQTSANTTQVLGTPSASANASITLDQISYMWINFT